MKGDGRIINLGAKTAVAVDAGDIFSMKTPGGGGYGILDQENPIKISKTEIDSTQIYLEKGSVFAYRMAQESV